MPNVPPGFLAEALFGPGSSTSDHVIGVAIIAVMVAVLVAFGALVVWLFRRSQVSAHRIPDRIVEQAIRSVGSPSTQPIVAFTYTVYTGYGFWLVQHTLNCQLPADVATVALKRMRRHNLTRGILGPGGPLVPLATIPDYLKQSRHIVRQARVGFPVGPSTGVTPPQS